MNVGNAHLAAVFGCSGPRLLDSESRFFREVDPLGFILFRRNIESPDQTRELVSALRASVGRADAPVLIDQEGGRVARLRPPHWRAAPPAGRFGMLAATDKKAGRHATWLNARLIADDLSRLGISVDCLPLLDLRLPETHEAIGDRAFSGDPDIVADLGRAACEGLLAGGILPVVKHIPGHGRAQADSHLELPVVTADHATLARTDFRPFRALADMPMAMTAHLLYRALDDAHPATVSARVIADAIRGEIGFDGLLFSDDLSMQALGGTIEARAKAALAAGCDVALHCNGDLAEMRAVAAALRPMDAPAVRRMNRAMAVVGKPKPFDREAALAELGSLLGDSGA